MTAAHDERLARIALGQLAEPGDVRIRHLVDEMGPATLHDALMNDRGPDGLLSDLAVRLADLDPVGDLERARRLGIRYIVPGDDEWPVQVDDLGSCEVVQDRTGAPLGLWVKGPLRLDEIADSVGVVGSRSATTYGAEMAGGISAEVAATGTCVVSGAAFGIDQAAHRGALSAGGRTVAVLACGVDRAYPAAHASLIDYLAEHGAVVSELAPGCSPMRSRFLARNRLIAGLTRGTVVVEAAVRSGALNTANWATRLNRPLMAVPGPVTSAQSQGAHQLIRTGAAELVTQGSEVLELVKPAGEYLFEEPRGPERRRDRLRSREAQVLEAVPVVTPAGAASIARTAGIALVDVARALCKLESGGLVSRGLGGWTLTEAARER
ncbi:DNA-processing protein DprA [Nocardioides sp. Root140]|uniref:DNA-processing protein DprA n=1 Tax=Nocardioides sp. Root140 TaxID=1736460 RepID=UPI0006F65661|nr:DNA-processing protein DprA [Nocardioides sp. Root140]KQY63827.1 DNA protecting protein DprA [Nocardioides sp. Root140]